MTPNRSAHRNGYTDVALRPAQPNTQENQSVHPVIVGFLVILFHNPKTNPNNAQIVFTTHDIFILDQEVFRRDQIWFCEKTNHVRWSFFRSPISDPAKRSRTWNAGICQAAMVHCPIYGKIKTAVER